MKILVLNTEEIPWCPKCYEEMNGCPLTIKKSEKPTSGNAGIGECRTPNSQQNTRLSEKLTEKKIEKKSVSAKDLNIIQIKNPKIRQEPREQTKIEKESEKMLENPTLETSPKEYRELANTKTELIPQESSLEPFMNLSKELSHSVNSLTNLETELFQTMKGLRSSQPDTAVKLYDPERVQSALECAKQIINSKRMKLDLFKFTKELSNENNK